MREPSTPPRPSGRRLFVRSLGAAAIAAVAAVWPASFALAADPSATVEQRFMEAHDRLTDEDPVGALVLFTEVAAAGGPLAQAAAFEQIVLMSEQGGSETVRAARAFLTLYPESLFRRRVEASLADALISDGRAADALVVADRVLSESPEDPPDAWSLRRAQALAAVGRADEASALAAMIQWENFKPSVRDPAADLAASLRAAGASAPFPTARDMEAQFDRYYDMEWFITAGWIADRLSQMTPDSEPAKQLKAREVGCLIYRNRWKTAAAALRSVKKLDPQSNIAKAYLLIYDTRVGDLSDQDGDARRTALKAAAALAPGTRAEAEAWWTAGKFALEAGRYKQAASDYTRVFSLLGTGWMAREALWFAGFAHHLGGDDEAAAVAWKRLYEFDPKHADADRALYWWGRAAQGSGDAKTARRLFFDLVEGYPRTYYGLAAEVRLEAMGSPDFRLRWWLDDHVLRAIGGQWLGLPILDAAFEQTGGGGMDFDAGARRALDFAAVRGPVSTRGAFAAIEVLLAGGRFDAARRLCDIAKERAELEPDLPYFLSVAYALTGEQLESIRMADIAAKSVREGRVIDPNRLVARRQWPMLYFDVIERNAREESVDPYLMLALAKQESAFQTHARSWAAAQGLMQVIPSTGRYIAGKRGIKGRYNLFDLETNVDFGTWYFARAYHATGGDAPRSLAGYNAGPGRATRWWGDNPGRSVDEVIELIAFNETRHYVKTILRNWEMYQRLYRDRGWPPDRDHVFAQLLDTVGSASAVLDD